MSDKETIIESPATGARLDGNIRARIPEPDEIFNDTEAITYLHCDNNLTADYAIVAAEVARAFGSGGRLPGGTIVEVCPGPGNLCGELLAVGASRVIGVDGSPVMIDHAVKKFHKEVTDSRMDFILGLAQDLPFADASVDGIVNFNSFHQFQSQERAFAALSEMARVLKPGGWGLIRDFRRDADTKLIKDRHTLPEIEELLEISLTASFTKDEFREMLEQIPEVVFEVINAPSPWRLPEDVCERIRRDPVKHWVDASFSQHVIIHKVDTKEAV